MEVVVFLALVVFLIILIRLNSSIKYQLHQQDYRFQSIQDALKKLQDKMEEKGVPMVEKLEEIKPETSFENMEDVVEEVPVEEVQLPDTTVESIIAERQEEMPYLVVGEEEPIAEKPEHQQYHSEYEFQKSKPIQKVPKKSFFERYPDLEKFIGENLINKIGIVILVLGLGYLVKYAIDKNWINEIGRVAIGVLSAGSLVGIAHRLRKNYKAFSSVLIGGGLALLYFTISLAFHTEGYPLYQQQTISFIILVFITIFAVFLSITYDRIEIAILAIIGGFASPLLLSTGSGNYIVLFSYVMLLNVGMLVLSYYKKWRLVNIVAFGFTILLFGLWLFSELDANRYIKFDGAFFFATGFFVIFFLMNIIYNIKYKVKFKVGDISLLLSNTFIYFSFVMIMLSNNGREELKGLFAVLLGAFNFMFAYYIHKKQSGDTNLLYLLIALVFTFITLAIPLQMEGNYITLFWALESVLLLWLGQKSGFKIMKIGSVIVLSLMLISIMMDWDNNYALWNYNSEDYVKEFAIIFNKMFITTLVSVASLIITSFLLRKEKDKSIWFIPVKAYQFGVVGISLIVFFTGGFLEVKYQAFHYFVNIDSQNMTIVAYVSLFVLGLIMYASKQKKKEITLISMLLSGVFILYFFIALSNIYAGSIYAIIQGDEILVTALLIIRWLSILSVYGISILLFRLSKRMNSEVSFDFPKFAVVFMVFTFIYLLSADLDNIAVLIANSKSVLVHTQKTGYAIIWGLSSFVLMIIGMKRKNKTVRILSLALFAITLIKLFVYDIAEISKGGKIIAFILLGVLLLVISFMYQKVKLLVADDDIIERPKENDETEIEKQIQE